MNYLNYFNKGKDGFPQEGDVGVEGDWLDVGDFEVPRGLLWIGDARVVMGSEGCIVEASPGLYRFQVKGMDFNGVRLPSRARLLAKTARKPVLGKPCGQAITDSAMVGIGDIAAVEEIVGQRHLDEFNGDLLQVTGEGGIRQTEFSYGDRSFQLGFVASGLGDGSFSVFPLEAGGKFVGIETEFLPTGYKME